METLFLNTHARESAHTHIHRDITYIQTHRETDTHTGIYTHTGIQIYTDTHRNTYRDVHKYT